MIREAWLTKTDLILNIHFKKSPIFYLLCYDVELLSLLSRSFSDLPPDQKKIVQLSLIQSLLLPSKESICSIFLIVMLMWFLMLKIYIFQMLLE